MIRYDGSVVLCYEDACGIQNFGKIGAGYRITDIWYSPKFEAIRKKLKYGKRGKLTPCQYCNNKAHDEPNKPSRIQKPAPNRPAKINWGIIGLGKIANIFPEGLNCLPAANLKAVASRSKQKARDFAEKFGIPEYYSSYEELINDSDIQVVYIATPPSLHCQHTLACLQQGKAVLCEKPFALNLKQVETMVELARKQGVFLMEALWTRFLPAFKKVKQLIESNAIGPIKSIHADLSFKAQSRPDSYRFNKELGGGALMEVGIYPVFLATTLLGKPLAIEARATKGPTGIDEQCEITMTFSGGQKAWLTCSFINQNSKSMEARISGDKGSITIGKPWYTLSPDLFIHRHDGSIEPIDVFRLGNGYNYEAKEVMDCYNAGKIESDLMSHADSLSLIETLDKIRRKADIVYPDLT
jgi:predicted dehydrogenase